MSVEEFNSGAVLDRLICEKILGLIHGQYLDGGGCGPIDAEVKGTRKGWHWTEGGIYPYFVGGDSASHKVTIFCGDGLGPHDPRHRTTFGYTYSPSIKIEDAWEVVEKLKSMGWSVILSTTAEGWGVILDNGDDNVLHASAPTCQLAVCRVALKAVK